ncbi:hypothetical protein [Cupriavidus necator]
MTITIEELSQHAFARFQETLEAYIANSPEDEASVLRFDHVCAALLLNAVYAQTVDPSFAGSTRDLGDLVLHTQRKVLSYLEGMQGLNRRFDHDRRLAIQDWNDGTGFSRIDSMLANLEALSGKFPYNGVWPVSKLAWALYEPVMREELAKIDPISSENLLLANLLNTRGEDYAGNMLRAMLEVSKQLEGDARPMDAAQLIALKSIASPTTSSDLFSNYVNFSVPHQRRTMEGIAQTYATLDSLNERYRTLYSITSNNPVDYRIWRIPVNGGLRSMENVRSIRLADGSVDCIYDFPDYKGGTIEAAIKPNTSVIVEREKGFAFRGANGKLGAELAIDFVDSIFRDYYVELEKVRNTQRQRTPQEFRSDVLTVVVKLVQDIERAHMFVDANSRISSTLLFHRLMGELPARGIHIENNDAMIFHDTWIDMLSTDEALAQLRSVNEYPALQMTMERDRVAPMQSNHKQQTPATQLSLPHSPDTQVQPSPVSKPAEQVVQQNRGDNVERSDSIRSFNLSGNLPAVSNGQANVLASDGTLAQSAPLAPISDSMDLGARSPVVSEPPAIHLEQRRRARTI